MPAYSAGLTAGMFTTYNGTTVASNVWIENGILDGNWSNTPSANTCLYAACRSALRIDNNSNSTAVHDIHFQHIVAQNWNNPVVELINNYPLPYNIWIDNSNVFKNVGTTVIFSFGFDHNFFIRDNYFTNWGVGLTAGHADAITTFDYTGYPGTSQFTMDVSGNTFDSTQIPPDGYGAIAEIGAAGLGWTTDFTFSNNHMNDNGTGTGLCLSGEFNAASISGNEWAASGPCELLGNNITVSGNTIRNGEIVVYPWLDLVSRNTSIGDNIITFPLGQSGGSTGAGAEAESWVQQGIAVSGLPSAQTGTLAEVIKQTAQSLTITAVTFIPQTSSSAPPECVYTVSGGSSGNQYWAFKFSGMSNGGNDGVFVASGATSTSLTVVNPKCVTETAPSGALAVSLTNITDYVAGPAIGTSTFSNFGGVNGLVGQDHVTVSGFTNSGNNGANAFEIIANDLNVVSVSNSSGVSETHAGTLSFYPSSYNANIGPDSIALGQARSGSYDCMGVSLGYNGEGAGTSYNVTVHDVNVAGQQAEFGGDCSGIFAYNTSSTPESFGLTMYGNMFSDLYNGILIDDSTAGYLDDVQIHDNKSVNVTFPRAVSNPPTHYLVYNNVDSSTQLLEGLNGGTTVDQSGDISSPGWVSGGVFGPYPPSGAVTWSSAVAVNVITLGGNVTSSTIANGGFEGEQVCFAITQGSSVYSIVWPSNMNGMSQPSQTAYSPTYQCAVWGASLTWQAMAPAIDSYGNTYLPGPVNAPTMVDRGLTSASLVGTNGSGTLVAASTTGTGNAVMANGPTFTGNTTAFANGAAAEQDVVIQPGTGADQVGALGFNNYSGSSEWKLRKDASNYLRLTDAVNSLDREIFYQNGQTLINSGAGANSVLINSSTGSGTGGFYVESGGSSPAAVFSTTASGNTTATGFVSGKFMMGSGTMSLGTGAAAGTGPTIVCVSGHVCDGVSGTVTLTTGTSTTTGTLATLSFPNTHSNSANCVVTPTLSGAGLVTSIGWSESTTALTLTANAALTASTAYQIRYWCGGN
jgi:hypothetical protein